MEFQDALSTVPSIFVKKMELFEEFSHPSQRIVDGALFPLFLDGKCLRKSSILDAIEAHQIRNCNIKSAEDLHDFIVASGLKGMDYIGGAAVRTQLTSRVFTANESPSSENIPFHHEMAQTPHPPTHLFFFCEIAPVTGGATPLLVSSEIYLAMAEKYPQFISDIEQFGVRYVRIMPEFDDASSAIGRGWRSTFLVETKEQAESALRSLGSTWAWLEDGNLKTVTPVLPAVRIDNHTPRRLGKKTFFNSIIAAYTGWNDSRNVGARAVILGDEQGSLLDPLIMHQCVAMMDDVSVRIPWQEGDIMLVDNRTVMHARNPFEGSRRVLASLVRDADSTDIQ